MEGRGLLSYKTKFARGHASAGEVLARRASYYKDSIVFIKKGKKLQDWLCLVIKDGPDIVEIPQWVPMFGPDKLIRKIGNVKLLTNDCSYQFRVFRKKSYLGDQEVPFF